MFRHASVMFAAALLLVASPLAQLRVAPPAEHPDKAALELILRKLSSTGTFMQTDAHPDDEDNGLLAMLGYGQGMRTALVTLTRGDGGQNEIGPETGQSLGVLRTEELIAVHRFDGAEQYFTRAVDFGFSFSVDESIEKWGHDEIVGDLVRHIRAIRPDVIAGFLCGGQAGGLHHQASAKLTLEAFRAAADPARYPEQITQGLRPWQAVRYFCTDENSFAPQPAPTAADRVVADLSAFDPLLGRTYAELGLEARSMHKCQGTSQLLLLPGQVQNRTYRLQDEIAPPGAPPSSAPLRAGPTMFDGIDVSVRGLARFAGGRSVPALTTALQAIQQSVVDATAASRIRGNAAAITPLVAGLRATRALRTALPRMLATQQSASGGDSYPDAVMAAYEIDFRLGQKERKFEDALVIASATRLDALADDGVVIAGQTVAVTIDAAAAGTAAPELRGVTLHGFTGALDSCAGALSAPVRCKTTATIPPDTHLSTPYWTPLKDASRYVFEADVPFGVPFRPTPFRATFELTIGGERVTVERPIEYRYSNLVAGEKRSQLNVSPPFDVTVDPEIAVFPLNPPAPGALPAEAGSHAVAGGATRPTEAGSHATPGGATRPAEGGSHTVPGGATRPAEAGSHATPGSVARPAEGARPRVTGGAARPAQTGSQPMPGSAAVPTGAASGTPGAAGAAGPPVTATAGAAGAASSGAGARVASGFSRKIAAVTVSNNQKGAASATVTLQAPAGWQILPESQRVTFTREDESVTVTFTLQPPANLAPGNFVARAVVTGDSGVRSDTGYQVVEYPHIHRRHVIRAADLRVKALDVTVVPGLKVGYVMGVGDRVPYAIEQLGADVTLIDADTLATGNLSQFDTIVLGVRAYERRQDLRANNQRLLKYVDDGGTVVVQYQRTEFNEAQYGPYPAKTTAERITDENAPMEVLVPDHPVFTTPNRIGPDAWIGWLQERGTYFLGERDPRYVDLLRAQDPFPYNAGPKTGILVEARVGKGRWLYTGLGLWRQLPAGTDGAYRLLANLISLGKH